MIFYWKKRFMQYIQSNFGLVSVCVFANNSFQKLSGFFTATAFLCQKQTFLTWNSWRLRKNKRCKRSHSPMCVPVGEW